MEKVAIIVLKKLQETIEEILAIESEPTPVPEPMPVPEPTPVPEPMPVPEPTPVLDSEGVPWDSRIHSSGKTFLIKDGTWKLARGVDPLLVAQVKTELKGGVSSTPVSESDGLTWAQLMEKIAKAGTGLEDVVAACKKFNVPNVAVLQDVPVLVPLVAKELGLT